MKIDDITFDRVMAETPVEKIEKSWRISGFTAAKKWCEFAHGLGMYEGLNVGIFATMIVIGIFSTILTIMDIERTWVSATAPFLAASFAFASAAKRAKDNQSYMYGERTVQCEQEEHNVNADDKAANDPTTG